MTAYEQGYYELYIKNMVTLQSLNKLVNAGKLNRADVDAWVTERLEKFGY